MKDSVTEEWYLVDRIDDLDSPCLLIYRDRVMDNINSAINLVGATNRLRPHVKTHKTKEISLLMKKAGISKFKCATIAEADMLGMVLAQDVLLAFQPVKAKLNRFISVIKDYPQTKFSCLVDNETQAEIISREALNNYLQIRVFIDVNTGMNRTGCLPQNALELYLYCASLKGIMPVGFHVYDGHLHDPSFEERKGLAEEGILPVMNIVNGLQKKGYRELAVIAGGSPTFPIHAANKNVECSPGTFIFWDNGYANICREQPFKPAAVVLSRIVSFPAENLICADLGHKSIASENILSKRVLFLNAPHLIPVSHSEEHLVLKAPEGHNYKIGDTLYGLPQHICPTCALYEKASVVDNSQVKEEWRIVARDRTIDH